MLIFGVKCVVFLNVYDVKGFLILVICGEDFVMYFEYKMFYMVVCEVFDEFYIILFGKGVLMREGIDVIIVVFVCMVYLVNEVVDELVVEGIFCEVVDLRIIFLFDEEMILESV